MDVGSAHTRQDLPGPVSASPGPGKWGYGSVDTRWLLSSACVAACYLKAMVDTA